ncbi:MAG: protein BatD [Gammaproteobacteria bacterium]|nr:protein BatD [Gammaproteobacteria bacterium]
MNALWRILGCLLLTLSIAAPALATATASVDRSRVSASESVQLRLRVDSTLAVPDPDLQPLTKDFEILSTSRNSRISLVNGQGEAFTEWLVELMPLVGGELQIPALSIGAERTDPIRISVTPENPATGVPDRDVFVELEVDSDKVHVQQQILLTVRVLHAVNFNRGASLEEPSIEHAVVRQIGEGSYEKVIAGRHYGVFERRYAIFPQASGELRIPPLAFQATVGGSGNSFFDAFGSRGHALRLRSPERRIQVAPPESGANPWVPASVLTLVETWDKSPTRLRVGESATRTLTLSAAGLTGAQLPELSPPGVDGLRFYPDQAEVSDQQQEGGITGTRIERSAVIPLRSGDMELPEVRLRWWDTVNQRFEEALVPAKTIRVLPAAAASATPTASSAAVAATPATESPPVPTAALPASTATAPWPWIIATLVLALATLVSSLQWWRLSRGNPAAAPAPHGPDPRAERELFATLRTACRAGDAAQTERLLCQWARLAFPDLRLRSVVDVARVAARPGLAKALQDMLASRYGNAPGDWDPSVLLEHIEALRAAATAGRKTPTRPALPPLYQG